MKILTKDLIKSAEKNAVESGAFSFTELMHIAGTKATQIILKNFTCKNKNILVVCGNGNNGGDGFVIADALKREGAKVKVTLPLGEPKTNDAKYFYEKLNSDDITTDADYNGADIIIDALFGIGLNRELNEDVCRIIENINSANAIKISVDIPSGVNADNGNILPIAIKADATITFIALKPCFVLPIGSDYAGKVYVADIGVKAEPYSYNIISAPNFKKRDKNCHKGTFGTALLVCGSYGMAGAAILAAKAALRTGVGIVKAVLCDGIYSPFTLSVPEAVCVPIKQNKKGTLSANKFKVSALCKNADAILVGCGLGSSRDILKILKRLITKTNLPIVIDADGINALANCIELIKNHKAPIILTPHPGEMARLTSLSVKEVEANRIEVAKSFAKEYGCILVLKGANTLVALPDGEISFNIIGNSGMAVGGCGDLLAGMIVSLLAQGIPAADAAKYAVYLHSEAGDKACDKYGERAMIPTDIIEAL